MLFDNLDIQCILILSKADLIPEKYKLNFSLLISSLSNFSVFIYTLSQQSLHSQTICKRAFLATASECPFMFYMVHFYIHMFLYISLQLNRLEIRFFKLETYYEYILFIEIIFL